MKNIFTRFTHVCAVCLTGALLFPMLGGCSDSRVNELISAVSGTAEEETLTFDSMQESVMDLLDGFTDPAELEVLGSDVSEDDNAPAMNLRQLVSSFSWRVVTCTVALPENSRGFMLTDNDGSTLYILEDLEYLVLCQADGTTCIIQSDELGDYSIYQMLTGWALDLDAEVNPVLSSVEICSISDTGKSIPIDSLTQPQDSTAELTAQITPSNAEVSIYWSSSDYSVAEVSEDGTVTCTGSGTCTITAEAYDENNGFSESDSITVTVME